MEFEVVLKCFFESVKYNICFIIVYNYYHQKRFDK